MRRGGGGACGWCYSACSATQAVSFCLISALSTMLVMPTAEVGVPLLAMHSARELMGVEDQKALTELLTRFWAEP